jgi:hypothetical protein
MQNSQVITAVIIALLILAGTAYLYSVSEAPSKDVVGGALTEPKISVDSICRDSLAYTTFPAGTDTEVYVQDCINGKYPEVIEKHVQMLNEQSLQK